MAKLLVKNPDGLLEIIEVGIGGFYSAGPTLWDERLGEPFPEKYSLQLKEDKNRMEKEKEFALVKEKAKDYLMATDWYVIRELDTKGHKACPPNIKMKRLEARAALEE